MILEAKSWFTEDQKALWEIVSSIAAMLAAIATFVTVREMRRSRKDSINPDLYIETSSIIYKASEEIENRFFFFDEENKFNLYNLGNGPAKDIKIKWENNIINRAKKLGFDAIPKNNTDHLVIRYNDQVFLFNRLTSEPENQLNFVLGREKSISGFYISMNAMELLQLESIYKSDQESENLIMFEIAPKDNSTVKIKYFDSLNKERIVTFQVTTKVTIFKNKTNFLDKIKYDFYFQRVEN